MSITYPLDLPAVQGNGAANIAPAKVTLEGVHVAADSRSPYTLQGQTYQFQGSMWRASFDLPGMTRAQAEPWIAFLLALRGKFGTFLMSDPANTGLLGNATGPVTVNGANQTGYALVVAGLAGTLKAGDYFQLGTGLTSRLHKNLKDKTGAGSLDIFPALAESPGDGSAVVIAGPKGLFRLKQNSVSWDIDAAHLYSLSFSAVEAR